MRRPARIGLRWPGLLAWLLVWPPLSLLWSQAAGAAPVQASVRHYQARIEPDIAAQALQGRVVVHADAAAGAPAELLLDAERLQIDAVRLLSPGAAVAADAEWPGRAVAGRPAEADSGLPLDWQQVGHRLRISLPPQAGAERRVQIDYRARHAGAPRPGIQFLPAVPQVFTAFSTRQWLPCTDAPSARATLQLWLLLPEALAVVANGTLLHREEQADGRVWTLWQQAQPVPCYLFGFAAGPWREVVDATAAPVLHFLAPRSFSEDELRRIFADTRRMIAFYADKAGMPYPGERYSQVLVQGAVAQELAGFAVMGERYGQRVLTDPAQQWLAAHELSHQWWGNAVTNRDWTEFWLNEGLASFMNVAWFEHRDGAAAYRGHIDDLRDSVGRVRAAGADKPLVFADWTRPTRNDRALVYDKGALLLHRLREAMGDAAFWRGLRAYTQRHWGMAVGSHDLQAAMQAATPLDLSPLFDNWVHGQRP